MTKKNENQHLPSEAKDLMEKRRELVTPTICRLVLRVAECLAGDDDKPLPEDFYQCLADEINIMQAMALGLPKEEKVTIDGWVARSKDGFLILGSGNCVRIPEISTWCGGPVKVPDDAFPDIKWEDKEPRKADIIIKLK